MSRFAPDLVAPRIWMGGRPREGEALFRDGIDVLFLCAAEHQPSIRRFSDIEVVHCPFDDDLDPLEEDIAMAEGAADIAADEVRRRKVILVTCWQGRNRSGLVVGLTLLRLGIGYRSMLRLIRSARGPDALSNDAFVAYLRHRAKHKG